MLVCGPGGHLQQMLALEPVWRSRDRVWATLPAADVEHLLGDEAVLLCHAPTSRHLGNMVRNLFVAWRTVRELRPRAMLSTGGGLAPPFFLVGKLLRVRLVYVESLTRTDSLSLSGRMIRHLADEFFAQWPEVARRSGVRYEGSVL
jgi:UDP-N-acetylglucosamine:LPS N-acetylglucosamine transferase